MLRHLLETLVLSFYGKKGNTLASPVPTALHKVMEIMSNVTDLPWKTEVPLLTSQFAENL